MMSKKNGSSTNDGEESGYLIAGDRGSQAAMIMHYHANLLFTIYNLYNHLMAGGFQNMLVDQPVNEMEVPLHHLQESKIAVYRFREYCKP